MIRSSAGSSGVLRCLNDDTPLSRLAGLLMVALLPFLLSGGQFGASLPLSLGVAIAALVLIAMLAVGLLDRLDAESAELG
jgi:hypothetical protein